MHGGRAERRDFLLQGRIGREHQQPLRLGALDEPDDEVDLLLERREDAAERPRPGGDAAGEAVRPDGLDERTRSYLEVVANAADSGLPSRSELYVEGDDAYELLEAYPVGRDRWALASLDITEVRHAEQALRRQEEAIRRAYVMAKSGASLQSDLPPEISGQGAGGAPLPAAGPPGHPGQSSAGMS